MRRVLVTGASGFLGSRVWRLLGSGWQVVTLSRRRPSALPRDATHLELDLETCSSRALAELHVDAVLHLGALTNADTCETEPELAHRVNVEASAKLARAFKDDCARFVVASTDLVFDGLRAGGGYAESDTPEPVCFYGKSKWLAEQAVRAELGERAIAARLALLYGGRSDPISRPSFAETMLDRARSGTSVRLFTDQVRSPLYVVDAAESLVRMLELQRPPPVLHLGGPERRSRYEIGETALSAFGLDTVLAIPSTMADVPSVAARPPDVSLDVSLARSLGLPARTIQQGFTSMREERRQRTRKTR